MSHVVFHEESRQKRVVIPAFKRLPPNPHITSETDTLQRALALPSATTTTIGSERHTAARQDKGLRYRLIACDQRSFLTGSASADLQAAHIINAVRRDIVRKEEVERLLTQQRVYDVHRTTMFYLDGLTNAILLEASLHVHWDLYGTFCIVPSAEDATAMLAALDAVNTEWTENNDSYLGPPRPLDITQPPFVNPSWEIVILHPVALLPDRQPLSIAHQRTLYMQGHPPPTSRVSWTSWIAYDDQLRSETHPYDPIPPFVVDNARSALRHPMLSSLAIVINAHCKLNQFMQEHGSSASPRVHSFADQMSRLVAAIFYLPPGFPEEPGESRSSGGSQRSTSASQSAVAHGQPGPGGGSVSCNENDADDAVEPPEVAGEDGLTDSEFRVLSAKTKDSFLDRKERADAAMMMIFGTRRYVDPSVAGPAFINRDVST